MQIHASLPPWNVVLLVVKRVCFWIALEALPCVPLCAARDALPRCLVSNLTWSRTRGHYKAHICNLHQTCAVITWPAKCKNKSLGHFSFKRQSLMRFVNHSRDVARAGVGGAGLARGKHTARCAASLCSRCSRRRVLLGCRGSRTSLGYICTRPCLMSSPSPHSAYPLHRPARTKPAACSTWTCCMPTHPLGG